MSEEQQTFLKELTRRRSVQVSLPYFVIACTVTEALSFLIDAIMNKIQAKIDENRDWLLALGDDPLPCVTNMRASLK